MMSKFLLLLSFIFSLPFAMPINAAYNQKVQNSLIQDLEVAKYNISVKYAPADWKNEYFGWNLENAFERGRERILQENPQTSREYQKIFSEFFASMQDYHVHPIYYSTTWSMFPIQVRGAAGKYFLLDISGSNIGAEEVDFLEVSDSDLELLANNIRLVSIGDEVIAVNGQPINELIEQLIDENFFGDRSPTGYALAERNLFFRRGKLGQEVPSGTFQLTLLRQGQRKPYTITLPWLHVPEWIANHILKSQSARETKISNANDFNVQTLKQNPIRAMNQLLEKDFSVGIAKEMAPKTIKSMVSEIKGSLHALTDDEEDDESIDSREKGFIPNLGRVLWESDIESEVYAYLYQLPSGNRVGYLYLSTFDYSGPRADGILDEIIGALRIFNNRADALVLDITNNTGGNMMFMYAVLSVLTDYPLKVPSHRELLIQEDVYRAAVMYNSLKGYEQDQSQEGQDTLHGYAITPKLMEQILSYASGIMKAWESGNRLTNPLYLFGIDEVVPHSKMQFKKPIIVLTNEYNFSCADFFPAILQDNKRAKIFGKKTAGAGGYVKSYPLNRRFGVQAVTLTASIAYRQDGTPIENLGVTPDVPYDLTVNDVKNNFVDYVRRLNLEVKKIIK